ncbi:Rnl2 family RNA ligase [Chitinophaga terrae (ex Kim and Jung 2007)]|uniref:RNA ligase family protein n=1 Tax=Chitinophaga terrae (ex Kim and Jung 2007) TaxID=408074 RepID=UPI00278A996E|nr:RNA ligase family protein [Chitinophaga terrae (ex Kim and Jung 2007)]MDQ0109528.1 Rnl2 family RNA ligase [Chitinophaga terrae (ex Kim and Jung 2007)]
MSEFSGYEKMPNSFKKLQLDESDFSRLEKLKWVVTEKVHGANFSFVYEDGSLKFAKRREYLKWTDDFFGFQLVVSRLENNILRLFERLSAEIQGSKYIVYGELFGGKYPHPDVEEDKQVQAVQTGVYYTPGIHFCAFDIAIETADGKQYLDYETAVNYFEQFGIFYAKPLFIGRFNEALNFNTRINSAIPSAFQLPELSNNLIEGVVVKPFNQPADSQFGDRPIVKLKNPEFDEEEKFHQAARWSFIPEVSSKTEDLSYIVDELKTYVTANRLKSAVSKIGALDMSNETRVAEIQSEFLEDVLTDFKENYGNILEEFSAEEKEWVMERLKSAIYRTMFFAGNE